MTRILEDLSTPAWDATFTREELEAATAEANAIAETEDQIEKRGSVVKAAYKRKYLERSKANGTKGKAAKRSAWDWLAQTLAAECLNDQAKIDIGRFLAVLDANGVDHSRWTNRSPGWEGRLRMTGRLALQKVVAETELLQMPDGEILDAPADWVAKLRS